MTHASDRQNAQQFEKKGQKVKRNMAQWRQQSDTNFAKLVGDIVRFYNEFNKTRKFVGILGWAVIAEGVGLVLLTIYTLTR